MKKIGVYEYAERIGVTPKTVYKMIEKGEVITTKDTVNNREVTRIVIEDEENLSTYTPYEEITDVNIGNIQEQNKILQSDIERVSFIESIQRIHDDYRDLVQRNMELAQLAGQAKLLTDSEHRTKEEYFKTVHENAQLKAKIESLQGQLVEYENNKILKIFRRL